MNWITLTIISLLSNTLWTFDENYISDYYFKGKGYAGQKIVFGCTYILLAIMAFFIFNIELDDLAALPVIYIIVAGAICSIADLLFCRALEIEDSTTISIFLQLSPIFYLIFGWTLLGESFSVHQLIAFAIIVTAPFLIIFSSKKKNRKIKIKTVFLILAFVTIEALMNVVFVKNSLLVMNGAAEEFNKLLIATTILLFGQGLGSLIICCGMPKLRKRFRYVIKRSKGRVFLPIITGILTSVIAQFSYLGVLVLAPSVALAAALNDSLLPVVTLLMGLGLSAVWPNFGREKLEKKTITVHSIATVCVVIGIIILQF